MDDSSEFSKWLQFAENDLHAALLLKDSERPLLEIICFHCQQSAEKYLKAFIVKHDSEIKRTHDLSELCKICTAIDPDFDRIKPACIDLTDYAVETRYPYPFEIESSDMNQAIQDALAVQEFVVAKIS